ncbi:efflux RND transporter periplasmic adaptor subunit [Novispirillum sp. DQ9]|uniref:efflux RND transporter periplasmic adaptor subunit n=1 Tax=Novispirillum sp. DQ9 TaxID=3398612 RepID=UPI003C7C8174
MRRHAGMALAAGIAMGALAAAPVLAQQAAQGLPVEAVTVSAAPLQRTVQVVGSLTAGESVMIRPEVAGRVARLTFEEGQPVAAGDVLVRLDDSEERARLASAEAQLALSQANHKRSQALAKRDNVSQASLEEAYARMKIDEAAVAVARTAIDKTLVRAPFAGVVGLRRVSPGAYVQAGQDIVNLESLHPLKVDFRVPELFSGDLRRGQAVRLSVDAMPGQSFDGEVLAVDPQVDVAGRSVMLRARVPNPEGTLRPGMFARVTLVLEVTADALMIPEQALVPRGQMQMVVKVVDGTAKYVPVEIGHRAAGMVQVTKGLAPGDTVVTAGQMKLAPDAAVTVLPPPAPAPAPGGQPPAKPQG